MSVTGAIRSIFVEVGLVDEATGQLNQIDTAATQTRQSLAGVATDAKKAGDSYRNVFLGIGAGLGVAGYGGLTFFKEGIRDLAKYQDAYAAFSQNVKGNTNGLVASLQAASGGLMDQGEMLAQANKALLMGLPQDKLEKMMLASRALARATGEDLTTVWTAMTSGTARQSPKMLEAIGIQMGAVIEAEKAWAKSQGISYAALTEEQKNLIFTNYVLDHSNTLLQKVDLSQDSLNETLIRSSRAWVELRQEMAEGALPIISSTVTGITWIANGLRALPGSVKGLIGIVAVLGTGMAILGSFTLLNAAAFMMLKKEMIAVTGQATLWGGAQVMLTTTTGGLTAALYAGAVASWAFVAPWLPWIGIAAAVVGVGYLIWDVFNKGWDNSLLGGFVKWLNKEVPVLGASFQAIIYTLKTLWSWITKIPESIAAAWRAVTEHPLFKIAGALFAATPIGMAITSAQAIHAAAPVIVPTAERIIASTRGGPVRTGDINYNVKVGDIYAQKLDEDQVNSLFTKATKQASKQAQRDLERDLMGARG